jgi:hypothetical protein
MKSLFLPTAAEAQEFMNRVEAQLADLSVKVQRASWVQENFITDDTQAMAADAIDEVTAVTTDLVEKPSALKAWRCLRNWRGKFMLLKLAHRARAQRPTLRREMTRSACRSMPITAKASTAARTANVSTSPPSKKSCRPAAIRKN